MLSRFFIDRPIFATVLSIVIALIGGISLASLPIAQYPRITPPGVSVSISFPGANAQTVADTVAAPIEQSVNGVPGMLYISSQSGNDGSYSLSCTFDVSTDLDAALVMVQNRVTLAMPLLPIQVQKQGITIRKKTPDILMIANFYSPDGRYDDIFLSNFVLINLKDEILRVDGVADANIFGERDYSVRVWLDPQKLASRNMTAMDVANAVRAQNVAAAAGQLGQPPSRGTQAFEFPIHTLGQLSELDEFRAIVVKSQLVMPVPLNGKGGAGSKGGGAPGSGIADPLQAAVAMAMASGSPTTSSSTSGNGATTGGTTSSGTISGSTSTTSSALTGSGTTGGGTSGGGATAVSGSTGLSPNSLTEGGASNTGPESGVFAATNTGASKQLPSASLVYLRDVADVEMGALNYNQACYFDGRPSVGLAVYQLPGTNALDVADRVRARLKELSQRFPEGVEYTIGYDTTPFISESIEEVLKTLLIAIGLVAIVVLFFLQDWKAMILPMIDVPVSLLGTFAVMAALGYSLNNISLFGLVLAIGIVVDDAIVVLENIERQMAKGLNARDATIRAMEEITGPVIGITLVLAAVFVPCAFLSGITGRFFQQFAITIAASTIISAVNALTMTPARALLIFGGRRTGDPVTGWQGDKVTADTAIRPGNPVTGSPGHPAHHREALPWWIFGLVGGLVTMSFGPTLAATLGWWTPPDPETLASMPASDWWLMTAAWFAPGLLAGLVVGWIIIRPINAVLSWIFRGFNEFFEAMTAGYGWTIGHAMRFSAVVLLLYGGLLVLTWWLFQHAPTGFVPQQDMGRCISGIQLPDAASLERTKEVVRKVEKIAREIPGVAHTIAICGVSFVLGSNGPNFGSLFIVLKPFAERQSPELKDEAIMAQLRRRWAQEVKDANVVVFGAAPIPGVSVAGGFKLILEDRAGLGVKALQKQSEQLIGKLKKVPGLGTASTQFRASIPQLKLDVNWDKANALGLTNDDVNKTMEIYQGSSYVNSFSKFGRTWQVTLQAKGTFRSDASDIHLLEVRNKWGYMVSLGTLVEVQPVSGPIFVNRYNLYQAAPITGSLKPGASSGDVITAVDEIANQSLPRSMRADWTELIFLQILEGNNTPPAVVFALVVLFVFLALAALYESWALPLAVILVVPLCVLCAIVGVLVTHNTVNIFVQIGLVVLVGLACKNAILIVEFAREKHLQGMPILEATQEASRLRLRPILMTSFAFILGVVPLVLASGAGAEMRRSLGIAVFSGMLGVTLFGIFLTPVFFHVIQGFSETRLFESFVIRLAVSCGFGFSLGLGGGYLVGRVGIIPMEVTIPLGAAAGLLGVLGMMGTHRRLRSWIQRGGW